MTLDLDDVIAAVATPAGPAERSVIRLSGAGVIEVLGQRFACSELPPLDRRFDAYGQSSSLKSHAGDPGTDVGVRTTVAGGASRQARRYVGLYQIEGWRVPVPVDLWLWPTTRSYTGQPAAELHLVGSPPIVDALLEQLYRDGARPARAGEFTLRAFLAGRVDLVQAEAVLGVIDAADHDQLETALTQLAGGLSRQIAEVRESLLLDLADLEAGLDFVDEDIEFVHREQMLLRISAALQLTQRLLQQSDARMVSGSRPRVVLAGLPNAGKSTLFNHLLGEQRAIVSDQAGTTRDYLSGELNWEGLALELVDTAGVDAGSMGIAAQAESLRQLQVSRADLVIWCTSLVRSDEDAQLDESSYREAEALGRELVRVWTKSDANHRQAVGVSPPSLLRATRQPASEISEDLRTPLTVSAVTGSGMDALRSEVTRRFALQAAHRSEWLATTAARSRDSLDRCVTGLQLAQSAAEKHHGDELISIELRGALDALGEICGAVHTDDILDRIFSRFCIGK